MPASVHRGFWAPPATKHTPEKSEADSVFVRQLMCVPTVSERIATALSKHVGGDLESLQEALRDIRTFPKVQIGEKRFLGKARIKKLARHLLSTGAA